MIENRSVFDYGRKGEFMANVYAYIRVSNREAELGQAMDCTEGVGDFRKKHLCR